MVLDALTLESGLTREFLLHHGICPIAFTEAGALRVAASEDALLEALDELSFVYGRDVEVVRQTRAEVEHLIERLAAHAERAIELARSDDDDHEMMADVRDLANQPPVIRYVNLIVRDAYDAGASDIHLDASRSGLQVRYRLDGVLAPAPEPPADMHQAVVSRIKLLAELDIAERRRPQDGRIRVRLEERELDVRVSTVPTMFGESVVLRLLDRGGRPVSLGDLGMSDSVHEEMAELAERPHGMVLVTGPTGSGKSTTLYAALARRDATVEKIITVEDPVEYQLSGITQVPVHRQAGVTFASALRSILRQDPDVIMIGEMRDRETAEIAVQSAMTGHLVFSTLHTNDAIGALPRLLDLGVPAFLVAATVEAILAQRLVRRICSRCAQAYEPDPSELERIAGEAGAESGFVLRRGAGCDACRGTGYHGRVGIFEMLRLTEALKEAFLEGRPRAYLHALARDGGMRSLREDGWAKVRAGLTTIEEVIRVVQD